MKKEELKKLSEVIKLEQDRKEEFLKKIKEEGLLKHYYWCERELERNDNIITNREKSLYMKSLFGAVLWGLGKEYVYNKL